MHGRNTAKWDERLEMDAYYAEHVSLWLDLKVIVITIKNVLMRKDISVDSNVVEPYLDEERKNKTV